MYNYKMITFQGCRLLSPCSFLMAQLKRSWQFIWKTTLLLREVKSLSVSSFYRLFGRDMKAFCTTNEFKVIANGNIEKSYFLLLGILLGIDPTLT